jgi:hypothetical protein
VARGLVWTLPLHPRYAVGMQTFDHPLPKRLSSATKHVNVCYNPSNPSDATLTQPVQGISTVYLWLAWLGLLLTWRG